jgi:hypothetical protein
VNIPGPFVLWLAAVGVWLFCVIFGLLLTVIQCLCWRVERWWFKRNHIMAVRKEEL